MGAILGAWTFLQPTGSRRDLLGGVCRSALGPEQGTLRTVLGGTHHLLGNVVFLRRPWGRNRASQPTPHTLAGPPGHRREAAGFCCSSAQASGGCRAGPCPRSRPPEGAGARACGGGPSAPAGPGSEGSWCPVQLPHWRCPVVGVASLPGGAAEVPSSQEDC